MARRKKKKNNVFNYVLIVLVLVGGAYLIYNNVIDKDNKLNNNDVYENIDINDDENIDTEEDNDVNVEEEQKGKQQKEEQEKEEQKNQKTEDYQFNTQDGEEVNVEANKMVEATGFSGASNYKFYLRGTTLYFKDVSSGNIEEVVLAYNVKDLYIENKEVVAELYSDGKVVLENNYITYK